MTTTTSEPIKDATYLFFGGIDHTVPGGRRLGIESLGNLLIASPHPDDETLGCGGLIALCAGLDCPVTVVSMTNGDASHPGDEAWRETLGSIRRQEQHAALQALGLSDPDIVTLNLRDGELSHLGDGARESLISEFVDLIRQRAVGAVFVPAVDDCHADHRVTARLWSQAVLRSSVVHLFSYQIWPPPHRARRVTVNELPCWLDISHLVTRKRSAVERHRSQLQVIDPDHPEGFRMPAELLRDKLGAKEHYALICDISDWSQ